ncbi:probable methyltransferase PMT9, partial [Tanacetum coccineum]
MKIKNMTKRSTCSILAETVDMLESWVQELFSKIKANYEPKVEVKPELPNLEGQKILHQNNIQFALERGIPSALGVLGTKRLPYPNCLDQEVILSTLHQKHMHMMLKIKEFGTLCMIYWEGCARELFFVMPLPLMFASNHQQYSEEGSGLNATPTQIPKEETQDKLIDVQK